jgi:uncharacterized membrane protein YdjX (TVP38/TMEM64 family)
VQSETLVEESRTVSEPSVPAGRPWWRTRAAIRFGVLALVVGVLFIVMITVHPTRQSLAHTLGTGTPFGPAIMVASTALLTAAMVPRTLLSAVGGILFGWMPGAAYVLLGVTIGAIVAYGIGRLLGHEFMERHLKGRLKQIEQAVSKKGVLAVVVSRLVPFVPFCVSNYIFGTTTVRLRTFVVGTVLGALPATLAYAAAGSATLHHNAMGMAISWSVVAVLGVSGTIGSYVIWRRRPRANVTAAIASS